MILPSHNARLTKVAGSGFTEDYGSVEGVDTDKWTGDAEAYVREQMLAAASGERLDLVKQTWLTIPANVATAVIAQDDSVTYTKDGVASTRRVRDIEEHKHMGIIRLHLWDE